MHHHTALRAAARSRRIDDASCVAAFARDENGVASSVKFFPALCAGEVGVCRCFGDQNGLHVRRPGTAGRGAELPPNRIFRNEHGSPRMLEQLPLLVRREFVIQGNENAPGKKDGVSGNQPLRLIGHDDASERASRKTGFLQSFGKRMRAFFEIAVGQALFFALAVGFNQTHFF